MKKILAILLCIVLMAVMFPFSMFASAAGNDVGGEYVLDEIIIKFFEKSLFPDKEKQYDDEIEKVLRDGLSVVTDNVYVIKSEDFIRNPNATINRFKNSRFIEYVEPNYICKTEAVPNDPNFSSQRLTLTVLNAMNGWDIIKEGGPIVAVVDSGIAQHPDLPPLLPGFSAVASLSPNNDSLGHGTGVAGTIGALGDNSLGGVGINWNANILPVKVDDANGTMSTANVAKGIIWAADNGAKIINLSLGSASDSVTMKNAIDYAFNKGCAIFAATGNDGKNGISYPARYSNVVAVGGTSAGSTRAAVSNYGVGMGVMGITSYSTLTPTGGFSTLSGTSFSCPQAVGLASLVWALNPNLTNSQVIDLIYAGAKGGGTYVNDEIGYGCIDIGKTLTLTRDSIVPLTLDTTPPVLTLLGSPVMDIKQGERYVEPGYIAIDDTDGDISNRVSVTGSVNVNTPGVYRLEYSVSDAAGNTASATRVVEVVYVDDVPPVLTLKGDRIIQIDQGGEFVDPGYTAIDNVDGNITSQVVVTSYIDTNEPGMYSVEYTVSDAAGNTASATRFVEVLEVTAPEPEPEPTPEPPPPPPPPPLPEPEPEPTPPPPPQYTTPPVITLSGSSEVSIFDDEDFTDPGYKAADCFGVDLTGDIQVTNGIVPNVPGIYTVTYTVVDDGGNTARETRTVFIIERIIPPPPPTAPTVTIVGSNPIILWLTSDTPYTEQGAIAYDDADGDISANVRTSGSVNRSQAGTYTVTYSVTNSAGLSATATREVKILAPTESKPARVLYNFSGQGKAPITTTHTGVVVDMAGWMNFDATSIDNKSAITVSVVNAKTGASVYSDKYTATGGKQFWADEGTYNVIVTLTEGNGNCKYGVRVTTPEEIYLTFDTVEVPLGDWELSLTNDDWDRLIALLIKKIDAGEIDVDAGDWDAVHKIIMLLYEAESGVDIGDYDVPLGEFPAGAVSYTVVKGDSLWKISQLFFGTGNRWYEIYDANRDIIGPVPGNLKPGQVLTIALG